MNYSKYAVSFETVFENPELVLWVFHFQPLIKLKRDPWAVSY